MEAIEITANQKNGQNPKHFTKIQFKLNDLFYVAENEFGFFNRKLNFRLHGNHRENTIWETLNRFKYR